MKKFLQRSLLLTLAMTGLVHAGEVTPAKNGKPQMTIVIPAKHNKTISIAAHTLQEYIEKICGVKLAINKDGKRVATKAFYIGACQGAPRCKLPKSGANWEGYVITERNGDVYFNGLNPTPIAMGVYSFLEDDLGVRWFAPGELWELVPKSKTPGTLKVDVKSRTVVPQTSPRIWSGHGWAPEWGVWCSRNKVGSSEVMSKRGFQNVMYKILPPEKYGKTHPEYYPLMPSGKRFIPPQGNPYWRPCESNPEVQKIIIDYIDNFFKKNPKEDSFSLGMDDITNLCCCKNCRAMDAEADSYEKQDFSDRHYKFVNIIAKEIRKKHPDKYIGVLIYQITRKLPRQVPVMEPNVFGYITENCAYWHTPGLMQYENNLTREWRKRVQHLSRYDYIGSASMAPRYYPQFKDKQIKFDKSLGMEGCYYEVYVFLPLATPMLWQISKLQWDTSLDSDKLLDEFMNIYGAAKPQMARFWDVLGKSYQTWRPGRGEENRTITKQARAISLEALNEAFAVLEKAEKSAAGDEKVLKRIEIHKSALKLCAYVVRPYDINLQARSLKIDSKAAADKAFDLVKKLKKVTQGREEFIEELKKRNDMLGKNINGFAKRPNGAMQLGAFAALESDIIAALFRAIEWYGQNAPDELEKIAAASNNTAIKDYAAWYLKNLRQGKKMQNLLKNGKFEIRNAEVEKKMKGCPQYWSWWTRGARPVQMEIVPEGRTGNALKLSRSGAQTGVINQSANVNEGEVYLLSGYLKTTGKAGGSLGVRFLDKKGRYCKIRKKEVSVQTSPNMPGEWQFLMLQVHVPEGVGAKKIVVNASFRGLRDNSTLLIDDIELFRIK